MRSQRSFVLLIESFQKSIITPMLRRKPPHFQHYPKCLGTPDLPRSRWGWGDLTFKKRPFWKIFKSGHAHGFLCGIIMICNLTHDISSINTIGYGVTINMAAVWLVVIPYHLLNKCPHNVRCRDLRLAINWIPFSADGCSFAAIQPSRHKEMHTD